MKGNLLIIIYLLSFTTVFGQTNTWDGSAGDNNWFNATNWDLNLVPTSAHDVVIKNGDQVEINMTGAVASTISLGLGGASSHLFLASGANLTVNTMTISDGQLEGSGTFYGNLITEHGGNVNPGDPYNNTTGTLTINGDYTQEKINSGFGGYLNILINGPGDFSRLVVNGTATLSEEFHLRTSYSPNLNDNFVFLTATTLSGTFTTINPNTWQITYNDPSTGNVKATFNPPVPANDNCAGATLMTLGTGNSGYTTNATFGVSPIPSCFNSGQYDIWYSLSAPASGKILVSHFNQTEISVLALYSGACGGLSEVSCVETSNNDNSCPQFLVEGLTPGNIYYLQVITNGQQSNVSFDYSQPTGGPSNDFCTGAIAASVGAIGSCPTGQISGTTVNAHHTSAVSVDNDNNDPCNWVDVYYFITAPASGNVKFISGTGSPVATFYSGFCGALGEGACLTSEGTTTLIGSATYLVKISTFDDNNNGINGEGKAFTFCLEEGLPPSNNECSGATAISVSTMGNCNSEIGTTVNATCSLPFPCTFDDDENYVDVWYSFTAPTSGKVTFISGSNTPFAAIYSGTCGGLSVFANGCMRGSGTVEGLTSEQIYYLHVLTRSGKTFDFCLEDSDNPPANNTCATAIATSSTPISVNSIYATTEALPPCAPVPALNGPDLWYTFVAPASGEITYSFSGGTIVMTVFSNSCGSLTEVVCAVPLNEDSPVRGLNSGETYYAQLTSIGATATGTATIGGLAPLPVELTDFKAFRKQNDVVLEWKTATEINNYGFEIEHSMNGGNWENIDFVKGNGTSNQAQSYVFTHQLPRNGVNYYRLKQIDFDGQFEYSDIQPVRFENGQNTLVQIFPNPVKDGILTVKLDSYDENEIQIQVYDLTGRMWLQQSTFDATTNLNVDDLATGIYLVEIAANGQIARQKVVIE